MPLTPKVLTANDEVVAWLGSLDVSFAPDQESWFTIDGIESPRQIGSDGAGGAFVLLLSRTVLYVSSEGRAGIIAENFEAIVQLLIARPYWLDTRRGGVNALDAGRWASGAHHRHGRASGHPRLAAQRTWMPGTSPDKPGHDEQRRYFAHSPLRNTGTLLPSARMPSMSVSAEPIIQSMWIRLWLPPCAAICCGVSCAPLTKHFE
ncbi:hypothetical protein ACVWY3_005669 [Bradyrhizobium sp. USDA 4486]